MRLHEKFFWAVCFFLVGVFIASLVNNLVNAHLIAALAIFLLFLVLAYLGRHHLAILGLFMILGAAYYFIYDANQLKTPVDFGVKIKTEVLVIEAEQRIKSQKLIIKNGDTKLQITTGRYPGYEYGDRLSMEGIIKKPSIELAGYFSKEGVAGLISFPKLILISKDNGSPIIAGLFKIKNFFQDNYQKALPFDQASFMSGLTLGSTAGFSDEFKEDLRITGTTHLVALSGYNISIIVDALAFILVGWSITRKLKLPLTTLFIIGFVIMTGAEASVVRAAIMAAIFLLAGSIGREYYLKNSIIAAAGAMVLINPKILVFDIGFQLSFAALLGIIYLQPWLAKRYPKLDQPSFINWRRNFLTTTAAQLAVLPLIIYHFSYFSPIGILTNVLLLEFIPITMTLGFFIGFSALIWWPLAWLISWPASALLVYELGIINFFANLINNVF
ncbi:MAG: ComEC/Rec2 family competence protein [bacterium]|nr:ComEC/Rec2 family competence protein [bacterium]